VRLLIVLDNDVIIDHVSAGIGLPGSFLEHEIKLYTTSMGKGLPGGLMSLSVKKETDLLTALLTGVSVLFNLDLDTSPTIKRRVSASSTEAAATDRMIVFGGSNAGKLSAAFLSLGSNPTTIGNGGFVINSASVTKILPAVSSCAANCRWMSRWSYTALTTAALDALTATASCHL
jgi:hypothetical protein